MENEDTPELRSAVDRSAEEKEARLPGTDMTKQDFFAKGLPFTYQDARCPTEEYFIQEYKDGQIHFVHFDIYTRKFTLVKVLA